MYAMPTCSTWRQTAPTNTTNTAALQEHLCSNNQNQAEKKCLPML